jgi:HlyD family secretion protein
MSPAPADKTAAITRQLGLESAARRQRLPARWIGALVLLLILIAAWLLMRGSGGAAVNYNTQPVQRGDLTVLVTATGNLQPTNQVDVGIEVSGTIASVEVDYNDLVEVGQVLARLDTGRLEAQVRRSEASLAAARARVAQTQATLTETGKTLERLRSMHKSTGGKIPSQQELDTAEANFKRAQTEVASARAAVAEAEATLKVNQTDLDKAVIRSPIRGIVLVRTVEPGQTVAATFQAPVLFTLAEDLAQMELHVDVDEADVGKVRTGQTAEFSVDAYPGRSFPAQVTQVRYGAQTVAGVVTYMAVLKVDNTGLALRPGMTATADIMVERVRDAILIPNAALRFTPPEPVVQDGDSGSSALSRLLPRPPRQAPKPRETPAADKSRQRVWVLQDGQPVAIPIQVGATDGGLTQLLSGDIEPGMALLVDVRQAR